MSFSARGESTKGVSVYVILPDNQCQGVLLYLMSFYVSLPNRAKSVMRHLCRITKEYLLLRREPLFFLLSKRNDTDECILPIHQQVEDFLGLFRLMVLSQFLGIDC